MTGSYSPVPYEFRELVEREIMSCFEGRIFFFNGEDMLDSYDGRVVKMEEVSGKGVFLRLMPENSIRMDRVITLFGKPGPAFDEYNAFGNQCNWCDL